MKEKKLEIHLGSSQVPEGKAAETLKDAFLSDHIEGDPYEFTYVVPEKVRDKSQPGIIFNWGCKKIGFGQVAILTREDKIIIDSEGMSKEFMKEMFAYLVDNSKIE